MTASMGSRVSAATARLERIYLAALRAIVLLFASVCILVALYFAGDGVRRWLTSTEVQAEPVAVSAEEALAPLVRREQPTAEEGRQQGPSDAAKATHAAFLSGTFQPYYDAYRRLATAYNKPEDGVLSAAQLAAELGYTPEAIDGYQTGDSPVAKGLARTAALFQTDAAYAAAQTAVVTRALQDPRLLAKSQQYKAAQKTAQVCSTAYELRWVWDPNSTSCSNWWQQPYGCEVRRSVPVRQCEAAYPAGIQSPLDTLERLDGSYRLAWVDKTDTAQAQAAEKRAELEATKAAAPDQFSLALRIFAGFLIVMFMFLLIAVERHLRRLARRRDEPQVEEPEKLAA